jgi:hypothetical protein
LRGLDPRILLVAAEKAPRVEPGGGECLGDGRSATVATPGKPHLPPVEHIPIAQQNCATLLNVVFEHCATKFRNQSRLHAPGQTRVYGGIAFATRKASVRNMQRRVCNTPALELISRPIACKYTA